MRALCRAPPQTTHNLAPCGRVIPEIFRFFTEVSCAFSLTSERIIITQKTLREMPDQKFVFARSDLPILSLSPILRERQHTSVKNLHFSA